jgi:hypothetical protein
MTYEFNNEEYNIVWTPETAFRTTANGKDTINLATDTFFALWVKWNTRPEFGMLINKSFEHLPGGGADFSYVAHHGYSVPAFQISGELINLDCLKYLMGACTTTGPVGSDYTHSYATSTGRGSYPPSFQILEKLPNDTGANTKVFLHTGCVIAAMQLTSDQNGRVIGTFTCLYANTITGLTLTTWPAVPWSARSHDNENTAITYNVGGSAYAFSSKGFSILIDNMVIMDKAAGETKPERVLWGARKIIVGIDGTPKTWSDFSDAETDPGTAKDIDITIKMSRNSSTDYTQFAFAKVWAIEYSYGTFTHVGRYLRRKNNYILNPLESGKLLTITQVDQKTNARF